MVQRSGIKGVLQEINYCNEMVKLSQCPYAKQYWINMATYKIQEAVNKLETLSQVKEKPIRETKKQFTIQELAQYDGTMGKAAYLAVEGVVYDVSWDSCWGGGSHFGLMAGKDLTSEFKKGHVNDGEVLKGLPIVGVLK